jgi:cleavage stimulation factor subunit 3
MFTKFIDVLHGDIEKVEKTATPENSFASNGSIATQPTTSSASSSSILSPQKELARRRTELGIAWIAYMRFARRAEGLKPARTVFGKARKDKWISWEIYEAAGTTSLVTLRSDT